MILIQIKKKNSLIFLILFIFTIISSKTFASNKYFQDKNLLGNQIKLFDKRLLLKKDTKIWTKDLNEKLFYLKQKIIINEDYLKLIKIFPSKKNIKSSAINQDLKNHQNKYYRYLEGIYSLKNLYRLLSLDENLDIYLVRYYLNFEKSDDEKFIWLSLCTQNPNYDREMEEFRKNLLQVFYFLNKIYPSQESLISYSKSIGSSESKIHKIVCKKFN